MTDLRREAPPELVHAIEAPMEAPLDSLLPLPLNSIYIKIYIQYLDPHLRYEAPPELVRAIEAPMEAPLDSLPPPPPCKLSMTTTSPSITM